MELLKMCLTEGAEGNFLSYLFSFCTCYLPRRLSSVDGHFSNVVLANHQNIAKTSAFQWLIENIRQLGGRIVHAFLYYGLSYNTNDLAGNPYFNFFVAGAVEFPCRGSMYFALKKIGRRPIVISSMAACGLAFGAMIFIPSNLPWLSTTFAMVGKISMTASFAVLYIYTAEMFPTGVRNVSLGSCSMCERIGSILAPFVRELGKATHSSVPNVLYALLSLSCAMVATFLPETRGLKLPDTLQEGEELGILEKKEKNADLKPPSSEVTTHM